MKTGRGLALWWRWLRRAPTRPRRKNDFGDHGTAFALDLSLEQAYQTGQAAGPQAQPPSPRPGTPA